MRSRRRVRAGRAFLSAALPLTLILSGPALASVAQITSIPSANQSWGLVGSGSSVEADIFWIRNSVSVSSSFTLTMRPGIIVKFDPTTYLTVNGSLQAVGTGANPISITSSRDDTKGGDTNLDGAATSPAPSDWNGIYLYSHTSPDSSRIAFCDIAYGGYGGNGMLTFQSGVSGAVVNCTLRSAYAGVGAYGTATPLIVDTSIQNSTLTPVLMDVGASPTFNRLTFTAPSNGYSAIGVRGSTLGGPATWPKRAATFGVTPISNLTYVVLGTITINAGASLTISPGVALKMTSGTSFSVSGNLTMNGTVTDSIAVTSVNDDNIGQPLDTNNNGSITAPHPNDWSNIGFSAGATGSLQYCRVKFGTTGSGSGMIEAFNVNLPISNTLLSDAGHGFTFHGTAAPTFTNVVINNMTSSPTLMSITCNPTFTNLSFNTNGITALGLIGEPVSGALHLTPRNVAGFNNITYYLMGGFLDVAAGSSLVIDAGLVIKFPNSGGVGLVIDGTLTANGSVSSPIVFTSERDNAWGNPSDTNGDGNSTSPVAQSWGYIRFTSTSTGSLMNYCRVENGSAAPIDGYACNIWISGCSPTLSRCNVNRGHFGIRVDGAATPTLGTADTVVNCLSAPIAMSAQSDPTFTQPYFNTNGMNGLALIGETLTQSGTLKYRPQIAFQPPAAPSVYAYVVTGAITVPAGLALAIQPQTVIKVQSGNPAFTIAGTLNAVGGAGGSNRIVFTSFKDDAIAGDTNADGSSSSPAAGNWGTALSFTPTATPSSVIRQCLFTFGGSGGPGGAAVYVTGSRPRIVSSDFLFNPSALTFAAASISVVDSCGILNCTNLPITMSLLSDPTFLHLTWSGNKYNVLGLLGETVSQPARLATRTLGLGALKNIAYAPAGNLTIASAGTWTINPGITLKLGAYGSDPTGYAIGIDGALVANGKPDSLIVFTSMVDDAFGGDSNGDGASTQPASGQWQGIAFSALTNTATTVMNHVRIRYAGLSNYPAITLTNTGFPITNTYVTAAYEGIDLLGTSSPTLTNVSVDSCVYFPVRVSLVSNPVLSGVTLRLNRYTGIGVVSETIAQDLLWKIRPISGRQNMPYLVDGTLGVGLGSTMTLQPGLIVKFRGSGGLTVNRALYAQGGSMPESLIVFTSTRDDFYGGRSDTSSAQTPPAPADWASVLVQNTAIAGQVKFKDCVFRYGGSGTQGALRCNSSSPSVDSCLFASNATGISVEGSANPVIHGSSFLGHTSYAVYNAGTSFCVDANGCWWGANNGPNDSNSASDVCGAGQTNAGSGDAVTNNVNYSGFVTSGLINPLIGDVSLNGRVLAYDASLIFQWLVAQITLSPLQQSVADVTGNGAVTGLDGSNILQWVAGLIRAFPAEFHHAGRAHPDPLAQRREEPAAGTFRLSLGPARQAGDEWQVPVIADGSAPIFAVELRLEGRDAAALTGCDPEGGGSVLVAHNVKDGDGLVAMGSAQPLAPGTIATLRFGGGAGWQTPRLAWGRVNETIVTAPPAVSPLPALSSFGPPRPNPARRSVELPLAIAATEAGRPATVEILDVTGRRIRLLTLGSFAAGVHAIPWDLNDARGDPVAAGVYTVRARVGSLSALHRLAVVR